MYIPNSYVSQAFIIRAQGLSLVCPPEFFLCIPYWVLFPIALEYASGSMPIIFAFASHSTLVIVAFLLMRLNKAQDTHTHTHTTGRAHLHMRISIYAYAFKCIGTYVFVSICLLRECTMKGSGSG